MAFLASIPAWVYQAAAAVGAGVSAVSTIASGRQQSAVASYNAAIMAQQARQQRQAELFQAALMGQQAHAMEAQARANQALANAEAQQRIRNAENLTRTATADQDVARENIRRQAREGERMQAAQITRIAASGVTPTAGSPLDVLAETAAELNLALNDILYEHESRSRQLGNEAASERFGAALMQAGAQAEYEAASNAARLRGFESQFATSAAHASYRSSMQSARLTRLQGSYAQKGAVLQGLGSLFSGAGDALYANTQWKNALGAKGSG